MAATARLPVVYISSPYTNGDAAINVRCSMEVAALLRQSKTVIPITPLLCHFEHLFFPQSYDNWLDYDLALIRSCADALLRVDAIYEPLNYHQSESNGADLETDLASDLGLPVFFSVDECLDWATRRN